MSDRKVRYRAKVLECGNIELKEDDNGFFVIYEEVTGIEMLLDPEELRDLFSILKEHFKCVD